eukprot:scaffold11051_cov165-Amphora_coffeaeformis.AAC.18
MILALRNRPLPYLLLRHGWGGEMRRVRMYSTYHQRHNLLDHEFQSLGTNSETTYHSQSRIMMPLPALLGRPSGLAIRYYKSNDDIAPKRRSADSTPSDPTKLRIN